MEMSFHQSSVYINLTKKQFLSALCRTCDGEWIRSTIDLNTVLGNSDGTFKWGADNFASSAKDVVLKNGCTLSAILKRKDGSWPERPCEVNLTEHITNHDGALRRAERADLSIAPNFLEKLDAVSGVLRSQQIAAKNSAFELEFITSSNNRLGLQELEVAFLRVGKLATAIAGEFDGEGGEAERKRGAAEAVLRPMIRAFEKVKVKAEKSLAAVTRICDVTAEYETTNIPILKRDVEDLRSDVALQVRGTQVSLETLQEAIATSAADLEATQQALKEAQSTKAKANSMETLIKHAGWVLLPIGLGMNIPIIDSPFGDAIKASEHKIASLRTLQETHRKELDGLLLQESEFSLALRACNDLTAQFDALVVDVARLQVKAELARSTIAANTVVAERLGGMASELEDKAAMADYKIAKREYAAHVVRLLDEALPQFAAVGDVAEVLRELREGDDESGAVKGLGMEIEVVMRKLEIVA